MSNRPENDLVRKYSDLIEKYVSGEMTASEFSESYMTEFKDDDGPMGDEIFWILQKLFANADAYCEPEIRDDVRDAIGEEELMESARETLTKLEQQSK